MNPDEEKEGPVLAHFIGGPLHGTSARIPYPQEQLTNLEREVSRDDNTLHQVTYDFEGKFRPPSTPDHEPGEAIYLYVYRGARWRLGSLV